MTSIFIWIMLIIATERATELIVESKIFEPIRLRVKRWVYHNDAPPPDTFFQHLKVMLDYLLHCGYCVSVWMGGLFALFTERYFEPVYLNWFISALFLHGMSNIYHVVYELIRKGRIKTHDVMLKVIADEASSDSANDEESDAV